MSLHKVTDLLKNLTYHCSSETGLKAANIGAFLMASLLTFPAMSETQTTFDDEQQLLASCQALSANPQQDNAKPCVDYIKGFVAGVWQLDQIMATQYKAKSKGPANWEERAYQTRASSRGDKGKRTYHQVFCTPNSASKVNVMNQISQILPPNPAKIEQLNRQIFNALKQICPADKTK
jgi:hypothetical protein